jgi:hypothetical protein
MTTERERDHNFALPALEGKVWVAVLLAGRVHNCAWPAIERPGRNVGRDGGARAGALKAPWACPELPIRATRSNTAADGSLGVISGIVDRAKQIISKERDTAQG